MSTARQRSSARRALRLAAEVARRHASTPRHVHVEVSGYGTVSFTYGKNAYGAWALHVDEADLWGYESSETYTENRTGRTTYYSAYDSHAPGGETPSVPENYDELRAELDRRRRDVFDLHYPFATVGGKRNLS